MGAKFHSESLTVTQSEFLSFDHFQDQCCKIYEVLRSTFDIGRVLTPVFRMILQIGFAEVETAELFLRKLNLCTPHADLRSALGGDEESLSFVFCAQADTEWQQVPVHRRRRLEARSIRQERQPYFDERLIRRVALLPERYQTAMQGLRKLRRQHAHVREIAVQFDTESSFETEFNSRTFDLAAFLLDGHNWAEKMRTFIVSRA